MSKLRAGRLCSSLALVLMGTSAVHAAPNKPATQKTPEIAGVLNSDSYGYDLTCVINGHDLGVKGGQSESMRQCAENSEAAEAWPVKERGRYAPLHMGRNTVRITYKRKLPKEPFGLDITYEVLGYPAPIFYAHVKDRDAGTSEGTFDIEAKPPVGFRPLVFTESDPATSGLLYVDQDSGGDGLLIPKLNGELLKQLIGRPRGVVPFSGLHPDANTLIVKYSTKGGPLHLFILGPKGASTHTLQSANKTAAIFVIQVPARRRQLANASRPPPARACPACLRVYGGRRRSLLFR